MTSTTSSGEEAGAETILTLMENHLDRALTALDSYLEQLERGDEGVAPRVAKAAQDANKAVQILFEERKKIELTRRKTAAGGDGFAFDLDAARDEIRSRLARLRATHDTGGVSEQSE